MSDTNQQLPQTEETNSECSLHRLVRPPLESRKRELDKEGHVLLQRQQLERTRLCHFLFQTAIHFRTAYRLGWFSVRLSLWLIPIESKVIALGVYRYLVSLRLGGCGVSCDVDGNGNGLTP